MNILITGATGFIGTALTKALLNRGDELIVLTRANGKKAFDSKVRFVSWTPEDEASWVKEIDGVDAVINLAGESIIKRRWTAKQKQRVLESRVHATQIITHSIQKAKKKPKFLLNASAMGYYGAHGDELLTEEAPVGHDFLAKVCQAWEAGAIRIEDFQVRVVRLRIGIVLGKGGGALPMMLPPFKLFLGGWLGSGRQWMSWIHIEDLVQLIIFCLEHDGVKGAINGVAPKPVTNKEFSRVLANVLRRPCLFPVPGIALKVLLGEMSEMLLTGQRLLPEKVQKLGFSFQHPDLQSALESIL